MWTLCHYITTQACSHLMLASTLFKLEMPQSSKELSMWTAWKLHFSWTSLISFCRTCSKGKWSCIFFIQRTVESVSLLKRILSRQGKCHEHRGGFSYMRFNHDMWGMLTAGVSPKAGNSTHNLWWWERMFMASSGNFVSNMSQELDLRSLHEFMSHICTRKHMWMAFTFWYMD